MPSHRKELVRARMEKTGESYQQALRHVRAQGERAPSAPVEDKVVRARTVADTAFSIAAVRAEEGRRPEGERLFVDPYASAFAPAAGALARVGFRAGAGAIFVWEGVIGYIDDPAIDRSLRFMAKAGGPRSRVAFTFVDDSLLGSETMAARTKRCGFASLEDLAGDALWRRYLPGEPHPSAWVTKVGLATV